MVHKTKTFHSLTLFSVLAAAAVGCASEPEQEPVDETTTGGDTDTDDTEDTESEPEPEVEPALLAEQTLNILTQYCSGCHEAPNSSGGMDYITDLQKLIDNAKVIPNDPDNSPLLIRLENGTMPPTGDGPSDEEIAIIRAWIEVGAPVPSAPSDCDNELITFTDVYNEIAFDLLTVDEEDRPFIRYLSLHDLSNFGACEDTLERARLAGAKLVNSLSTNFEATAPVITGTSGTLLRLDMREYNWDAEGGAIDRWEQSLAFNRQVARIDSDNAASARDITGTEIPVQTLSSFLYFATQPPLYHDMLGIPETLDELTNNVELGINVDLDQAIADDDLTAAGVVDSGVSNQNRLVFRIPIASGRTFWQSFDYDSNVGTSNILVHPLDSEPAGSEIIFSLPNGLHAYMIVNAAGDRIDVAPTEVVQDPLQRTNEVVNGISCMSCHSRGFIPVPDDVRDFVNLYPFNYDSETIELVNELFSPRDEFQARIDADNVGYQFALNLSGVDDFPTPDPLVQMFLTYDRDLSLDQVAAELGVSLPALEVALPLLDPTLLLLKLGGRISRDEFNAIYLDTLCGLNSFEATVVAEDCPEFEP